MSRSIGMISFYLWSFIATRTSSSENDFLLSTKFVAWRPSLGNGFSRVHRFRIEHGKMEVFKQFVESTKQNLASTIAVFKQLVEPIRHDLGNRMTVFRQVVESTRQGLENKMLVFNHTKLVLSVGQGLSFILAGILLNLISNRIWDVEQKNVSGLTILVHYIPMSFVHYLPLSITTLIVWCVGNRFFVNCQDIGHLPLVAGPPDPQIIGPSHPQVAQHQDSLPIGSPESQVTGPPRLQVTGQPHPQIIGPSSPQFTGPAEPQATAPRDLGILDDHLRVFFYHLKQNYRLPAPAMSPTSTIDSISYAPASPGIMALTVHIREVVTNVEAVYGPVVTLPSGSKVLYRRLEIGPQTGIYELEDLRKLVLESMSRARTLDPDCTLQFGSFAVLKYTDSGLTWWRLQGHWTPTISDIRQCPRNVLDSLSGSRRKWIVKGWNLETATLKAATVDEIENVKVLHRYKMESGEDVLLCEEPHLVPNSAPMFRKKLYICASNSVEVQEKVVFDLQSEPMNFRRSYWNFVMADLMPSRWTMTMILSLSLLGGWSRATHGTGLPPKLAWGRFDLPYAYDINIVGVNLILSHTWNEIYKFFLIYMFVMFIPIYVWMLRQLQYDQILQSGSDLPALRRSPTLEETTSTPSPTVQALVENNLSEYTLRRSSPATPSFEDKKLEGITSSSTPTSPAPVKSSMKTFDHFQEEDDDVPDPAGYARDGQYLSSTAQSPDKYPTVPMQGFVDPARCPEHESNRRVLNITDHLDIKPENAERNKIDEGNLQEYEDGVNKTDLPDHLNQGLEVGGFPKESSSQDGASQNPSDARSSGNNLSSSGLFPGWVDLGKDEEDGHVSSINQSEGQSHSDFPTLKDIVPPPPPPPPLQPLPPDWKEAIDFRTGHIYYYNLKTSESSWVRPKPGIVIADQEKPENTSTGAWEASFNSAASTSQKSAGYKSIETRKNIVEHGDDMRSPQTRRRSEDPRDTPGNPTSPLPNEDESKKMTLPKGEETSNSKQGPSSRDTEVTELENPYRSEKRWRPLRLGRDQSGKEIKAFKSVNDHSRKKIVWRRFWKQSPIEQIQGTPERFSYRQLQAATKNFSMDLLIGQGGSARVYRGVLSSGIPVAVKRMEDSTQAMKHFMAEVSTLGQLRHRNVIQILGWCKDSGKCLLVYEFMPNGSLSDVLLRPAEKGITCLSWPQRFNILTGTAAALDYLHQGCEQPVIHRDVKTSNIMLDGEWNAKFADFGLARLSDHEKEASTTIVAGTIGYIAPEVMITGKFSNKTDVFAFGVVVLEVACGRKAVDHTSPNNWVLLVDWVWSCMMEGDLLNAVDKLLSDYDSYWMEVVLKVGLLCSLANPLDRPSMREVIQVLAGDVPLPTFPSSRPAPTLRPPFGPYRQDGSPDSTQAFDPRSGSILPGIISISDETRASTTQNRDAGSAHAEWLEDTGVDSVDPR